MLDGIPNPYNIQKPNPVVNEHAIPTIDKEGNLVGFVIKPGKPTTPVKTPADSADSKLLALA